jgi:hypothetical protein
MLSRTWGVALLLIASEALGLLVGQWFFGLFRQTVPPAVMTGFHQATAHGAFLAYGALLGVGMAAWALVAVVLARFFAKRPRKLESAPRPGP